MSFLSDNLGFEAFNLRDMLKSIKKKPLKLLVGAAEPVGNKVWSGILGHKAVGDPVVDAAGGPYGGHVFSAFGDNSGGVYGRAKAAGINVKPAQLVHDAAHVVAAYEAGAGLGNSLGSTAPTASTTGAGNAPVTGGVNGIQMPSLNAPGRGMQFMKSFGNNLASSQSSKRQEQPSHFVPLWQQRQQMLAQALQGGTYNPMGPRLYG